MRVRLRKGNLIKGYTIVDSTVVSKIGTTESGLINPDERKFDSPLEAVNHVHHWTVVALMGGWELE